MSVSVFDAVYKQIIRYVQVVFLCTMLVFLYSAIRSVFAVLPVPCILSLLCAALFGWLIWRMQCAVKGKNLKKIPFLLRVLIHLLRKLYQVVSAAGKKTINSVPAVVICRSREILVSSPCMHIQQKNSGVIRKDDPEFLLLFSCGHFNIFLKCVKISLFTSSDV